ncbi:MAG TPA: quinonprotein alcohol dehydrogenase [Planctomycetes bacterium]|nr:quinonprotein alcohol dehydrogenase [Planctomycetota bacterium]
MAKATLTCILLAAIQSAAFGEVHWNQFRGPDGNGNSTAKNLPVEFDETKNVRWKTAIHDQGWSSPVVWGDQIWLTSGRKDGTELFAICVDLESGRVVHDVKVLDVADPRMEYSQNPHACSTPFIEQGRLYVHYGSYGTACIDTGSGKIIWKRQDLRCNHRVGPASSPIVSDNTLFLQFDGVDVQYVAALNKNTGDTIWTKDREVNTDFASKLREQGLTRSAIEGALAKKPGDNRKSYATPTLIEYDGKQQLISPGAEVLFSYDPRTGNELWRVEYTGWAWNVACRPILANGLVYATSGLGNGLFGVRPNGNRNVTTTHVAWSSRRGVPNMSSPIIVDDLLFMVADSGGIVTCLNAFDGKQIWRKRLNGDHWASPVYVNGKIYFSSKQGEVVVLTASKNEPDMLARNQLNAEFIASPAVANDSLVMRSTTHLYCFANGYERTAEQVSADVYPLRNDREKKTTKRKTEDEKLKVLSARLKELVKNGKLTGQEAQELYRSAAGSK